MEKEEVLKVKSYRTEDMVRSLYDQYYQRLCRYANTFIADMDVCRDLVQDIYVKLMVNVALMDSIENFEYYLLKMTKHSAIDYLKENQRSNFKDLILEELSIESSDDNEMEAVELAQKIDEAIGVLPDTQRLVFTMSRFQDKSYADIADELNCSVKNVEYHMSRALATLRVSLKDFIVVFLIILVG